MFFFVCFWWNLSESSDFEQGGPKEWIMEVPALYYAFQIKTAKSEAEI